MPKKTRPKPDEAPCPGWGAPMILLSVTPLLGDERSNVIASRCEICKKVQVRGERASDAYSTGAAGV
jgi:hypothetical protein